MSLLARSQVVKVGAVAVAFAFSWNRSAPAQVTDPVALSLSQAQQVAARCWDKRTQELKAELQAELDAGEIKAAGKAMPILVKQFGQAPASGASLYISMHGGGNASAGVNDQQWRNQIQLYEPEEGFYVAPRAPTNSWNLWHEDPIDDLFDRLILALVVCKNVDPNRVYLMGYSAGGDGVFQLAPRMSDRFAAAAMMAGHPNETKADGLRNLPFALFMGADDAAYHRNKLAVQWRDELKKLQDNDPAAYVHWVQIYPETGHWMNRKDREALPWLKAFTRNGWPKKVVWLQDDRTHTRLYWLGVNATDAKPGAKVIGAVDGQAIRLESDVQPLKLYLSDELLDLDRPITILLNGRSVFEGKVARTEAAIEASLAERLDQRQIASAIIEIP